MVPTTGECAAKEAHVVSGYKQDISISHLTILTSTLAPLLHPPMLHGCIIISCIMLMSVLLFGEMWRNRLGFWPSRRRSLTASWLPPRLLRELSALI